MFLIDKWMNFFKNAMNDSHEGKIGIGKDEFIKNLKNSGVSPIKIMDDVNKFKIPVVLPNF